MIETDVTPVERRRHHRTQVCMPVRALRLDPDGEDLVAELQMMDISRSGIGAVSEKSFYPGQRLLLKLPAPGMGVRSVCAIIRRCDRVAEQYRVGIEFSQPLASLCAEPASPQYSAVAA